MQSKRDGSGGRLIRCNRGDGGCSMGADGGGDGDGGRGAGETGGGDDGGRRSDSWLLPQRPPH